MLLAMYLPYHAGVDNAKALSSIYSTCFTVDYSREQQQKQQHPSGPVYFRDLGMIMPSLLQH